MGKRSGEIPRAARTWRSLLPSHPSQSRHQNVVHPQLSTQSHSVRIHLHVTLRHDRTATLRTSSDPCPTRARISAIFPCLSSRITYHRWTGSSCRHPRSNESRHIAYANCCVVLVFRHYFPLRAVRYAVEITNRRRVYIERIITIVRVPHGRQTVLCLRTSGQQPTMPSISRLVDGARKHLGDRLSPDDAYLSCKNLVLVV